MLADNPAMAPNAPSATGARMFHIPKHGPFELAASCIKLKLLKVINGT